MHYKQFCRILKELVSLGEVHSPRNGGVAVALLSVIFWQLIWHRIAALISDEIHYTLHLFGIYKGALQSGKFALI